MTYRFYAVRSGVDAIGEATNEFAVEMKNSYDLHGGAKIAIGPSPFNPGSQKAKIVYDLAKGGAALYTGVMALAFVWIVCLPLLGFASFWIYLALLPLPLAAKACLTVLSYREDWRQIIPAMTANMVVVLGVDLLLAVGVWLG